MSAAKKRIVVFASGQGTNLQALIDACKDGALDAHIVGVVSHAPTAIALRRAEKVGIPTTFVPLPKRERAAWDAALAERVRVMEPDVIVLAGWMRVLGAAFLDHFPGRVLNLHPALPDDLPGLHAIERAWDEAQAGLRKKTGVMVHLAVPEVDAGPVVVMEEVPIGAEFDAFETRMHAVEHRLVVEGVRRVLAGL